MALKSALSPNMRPIAEIKIDFPAPVSPVIAVKPFLKSIDNSQMHFQ